MKTILIFLVAAGLITSCKSLQQTRSGREEEIGTDKNEIGQPILIRGKKRQLVLGNGRVIQKQNRKAEKVPKYEFDNKE